MTRKKDTKVQEPGLTKKTLPKDVIASLKEFRKNRSLKGISLKKTIKEGRQ
jgi:hypothetical protein